MPRGIEIVNPDDIPNYGKVIVEPLERGWGLTVGNSLRRILLSSLQGASVTSIKIDGVYHEYSTIPGVSEDVTDIILNIKKMKLKIVSDEDHVVLKLDAKGEGSVTAGDIEEHPSVEILEPDHHIATINSDANLKIELHVCDGRGYVSAEVNKENMGGEEEVGRIYIDSLFSPVLSVNYSVENTRVRGRTDLDKLILEVWTDGSITVEDSVGYAAKLMYDHLQAFINFEGDLEPIEEEMTDEKSERVKQILRMKLDELELSVRSSNCLRAADIKTVADLVSLQESDMLKFKNFGRKSLNELHQVLNNFGFTFGMDVTEALGKDNN